MICEYKWRVDKSTIGYPPNLTIERLKTQIHAALALVVHTLDVSPMMLEQLDWDPRNWKLPLDEGNLMEILPQVKGLNIHKSSAPPYQRKTRAELFLMGETFLDKLFCAEDGCQTRDYRYILP